MILTAWRIVKARHAAHAFDGEGAQRTGGRWNAPGTPVVYASESAALAALELLVHLGRSASLSAYVLIPCTFDASLVSKLDRKRLPRHWRSYPAPLELQRLGDEWANAQRSAILEVPSAVIDSESNYLFNPKHNAFSRIRRGNPQPFEFDLRLLKI